MAIDTESSHGIMVAKETIMRIGLVQLNPTIGDLEGNLNRALKAYDEAKRNGAELVVFPEMAVIGYCPKDLLAKEAFRDAVYEYNQKWATMTNGGPPAIFGSIAKRGPLGMQSPLVGKPIINAALLATNGNIADSTYKSLLPTYDVFDEERWFAACPDPHPIPFDLTMFKRRKLGVCICEDIWSDKDFWNERLYAADPVESLISQGADIIINLSASPYAIGKPEIRRKMLSHTAQKYNVPVVYVNQVGGNDDIIYDGRSTVVGPNGTQALELPSFEEAVKIIDVDNLSPASRIHVEDDEVRNIFEALVLGVRDYAKKCGFKKALIGLSGGIDSALTAVIAKEALGSANILGVSMPSKFSSNGSILDAEQLAQNLGIGCMKVYIADVYSSFHDAMYEVDNPDSVQLWEENLQARIRGSILMSISNAEGRLLLTTGNKSEVAVGYCTLYGDTCGGLAVLSDVYKTQVYDLARWYNTIFGGVIDGVRIKDIIPASSISKAPSAELKPGQKDQDSLPPYGKLDAILKLLIEDEMEPTEIAAKLNYSLEEVRAIATKVDRNEYKRRQLAPGIRVSRKAFGTGRLVPIAQGWRK